MPTVQQLFLYFFVVAFSSLPIALLYVWVMTKAWKTALPIAREAPEPAHHRSSQPDPLTKAA